MKIKARLRRAAGLARTGPSALALRANAHPASPSPGG